MQIQSHWRLGFQQMNLGGHKHSVHNTNEDENEFCISFM